MDFKRCNSDQGFTMNNTAANNPSAFDPRPTPPPASDKPYNLKSMSVYILQADTFFLVYLWNNW